MGTLHKTKCEHGSETRASSDINTVLVCEVTRACSFSNRCVSVVFQKSLFRRGFHIPTAAAWGAAVKLMGGVGRLGDDIGLFHCSQGHQMEIQASARGWFAIPFGQLLYRRALKIRQTP